MKHEIQLFKVLLSLKVVKFHTKMYLNFSNFRGQTSAGGGQALVQKRGQVSDGGDWQNFRRMGGPPQSPPRKKTLVGTYKLHPSNQRCCPVVRLCLITKIFELISPACSDTSVRRVKGKVVITLPCIPTGTYWLACRPKNLKCMPVNHCCNWVNNWAIAGRQQVHFCQSYNQLLAVTIPALRILSTSES